jgi:polysaccharide export outer membrane protein
VLAGAGILLGLFTVGGCRSAPRGPELGAPPLFGARASHASELPPQPIAPHNVVRWSVASGQNPRSPAVTGRDTVAPDGILRLGPYGSIQVAGLLPEEARTAITNHVARQLPDPRVTLQVESAGPNRPLQRLFSRSGDGAADAGKGWQYTKPPAPNPGGRLAPVAQPSASAANGGTNAIAGKPAAADPRIRQVSGEGEPETAPPPTPIATHPPMFHPVGNPDDKPIPRELAEVSLPPYVIDPPDILLVESTQNLPDQAIRGTHLVRPDGTIGLGIYGSVKVAGLTLEQAKAAIIAQLSPRIQLDPKVLSVDVISYNSKFYYVITDGAGYGEQVVRIPITGSEKVLDALSLINGLPPVASKKHIWVARRTPNDGESHQILPVDWVGITQRGQTATNYQIMPGDRVYVQSDKLIRVDNALAKFLNPIERLLGVTLLGSSVVNSIEGRSFGGGGGFR